MDAIVIEVRDFQNLAHLKDLPSYESRWVRVAVGMFGIFEKYSFFFVYFFMFIYALNRPYIITLPYTLRYDLRPRFGIPLTVSLLGYALFQEPQPNKKYFHFLFRYTTFVISIKFLFQIFHFCNITFGSNPTAEDILRLFIGNQILLSLSESFFR